MVVLLWTKSILLFNPLLAGFANEAEKTCAFGVRTAAANKNDQSEMRSSGGELHNVLAITSDRHALVTLRGRESVCIWSAAREKVSLPNNIVFVPLQSILDRGGHVVVEKEFHCESSSKGQSLSAW